MGLVFGGLTGPCDGYLLGAFSSHLPRLLHPHRRRRHRPQASLSQGEVEALVHLLKDVEQKSGRARWSQKVKMLYSTHFTVKC